MKTLALDSRLENVHETLDVIRLPVENRVAGDGLPMSHEQHHVGGQLAFRAFEIGQPLVIKAVTEEGVHVAVHQVADEHLWRVD